MAISKKSVRAGLADIAADLRAGKIEHHHYGSSVPQGVVGFNMMEIFSEPSEYESDCGTVACIGGHLALRLGSPADTSHVVERMADACRLMDGSQGGGLTALFYPPRLLWEWRDIKPKEAATAIDRYLAGQAPWSFVRDGV